MPEVKNLVANIPFVANIRDTDHPVYFRLIKDFFNALSSRCLLKYQFRGKVFLLHALQALGDRYFETKKILQPIEIKKTI